METNVTTETTAMCRDSPLTPSEVTSEYQLQALLTVDPTQTQLQPATTKYGSEDRCTPLDELNATDI
jgi:hypothetical protein